MESTMGSVKKDAIVPAFTCHCHLQMSEESLQEGNVHPLKVLLDLQGP